MVALSAQMENIKEQNPILKKVHIL